MLGLEELQLIALDRVVNPTMETFLNKVRLWFSKTYSTSIFQVLNIPDEYLVTAYFESQFDELEPQELRQRMIELSMTKEEKAAQEKAAQAFDDALLADLDDLGEELKSTKTKQQDSKVKISGEKVNKTDTLKANPSNKPEKFEAIEEFPDISVTFE